jgi:RHS repeat-associated protein
MDDPSTAAVTEGFGLMFYNARWYDPALGRFAQADSIVPPGVQGWDRYAAMNNNPVKYIDPSGHLSCSHANAAEGDCTNLSFAQHLEQYGIHFVGNFPVKHYLAILQGIRDVGAKFAQERGRNETVFGAFQSVYGLNERPLYYLHGNSSSEFMDDGSGFNEDGSPRGCQITSGGCTVGKTRLSDGTPVFLIKFVTMSSNPLSARNNAVHELGHLFGSQVAGYREIGIAIGQYPNIFGRPDTGSTYGFASARFPWQQATNNVASGNEVFADQFLGWTYGAWDTGETMDIGQARSNWMDVNMVDWLSGR